jgi:hypothetical protein
MIVHRHRWLLFDDKASTERAARFIVSLLGDCI